jgi:hypothetical protein
MYNTRPRDVGIFLILIIVHIIVKFVHISESQIICPLFVIIIIAFHNIL